MNHKKRKLRYKVNWLDGIKRKSKIKVNYKRHVNRSAKKTARKLSPF